MIGIIDYGFGNIKAIANIYKNLQIPHCIVNDDVSLNKADKLILPGVGAFDSAMQALSDSGIRQAIDASVMHEKKPILGICVGMQMLASASEEGCLPGLGWVPGNIKKFDVTRYQIQTPHMGWNTISPSCQNPLLAGVDADKGFYFLHSYYFESDASQDVIAKSYYGADFACIVGRENIFGVQFHPEKSHQNGILILKNFALL